MFTEQDLWISKLANAMADLEALKPVKLNLPRDARNFLTTPDKAVKPGFMSSILGKIGLGSDESEIRAGEHQRRSSSIISHGVGGGGLGALGGALLAKHLDISPSMAATIGASLGAGAGAHYAKSKDDDKRVRRHQVLHDRDVAQEKRKELAEMRKKTNAMMYAAMVDEMDKMKVAMNIPDLVSKAPGAVTNAVKAGKGLWAAGTAAIPGIASHLDSVPVLGSIIKGGTPVNKLLFTGGAAVGLAGIARNKLAPPRPMAPPVPG